jgi:hypothetical protein
MNWLVQIQRKVITLPQEDQSGAPSISLEEYPRLGNLVGRRSDDPFHLIEETKPHLLY